MVGYLSAEGMIYKLTKEEPYQSLKDVQKAKGAKRGCEGRRQFRCTSSLPRIEYPFLHSLYILCTSHSSTYHLGTLDL